MDDIRTIRLSMSKDEWMLRQMLWEEHPCELKYGDDGERQCGKCVIDFLRDDVESIRNRIDERNNKRFEEYIRNHPETTDNGGG